MVCFLLFCSVIASCFNVEVGPLVDQSLPKSGREPARGYRVQSVRKPLGAPYVAAGGGLTPHKGLHWGQSVRHVYNRNILHRVGASR